MITIIAITGKAKSGKSTAAFYLKNTYRFTKMRFAERLKRMLESMGLSRREIDGDLKLTPNEILGGKTPRYTMQTLGTEWGRNLIHPDLWVKLLNRDLEYEIRMGRRFFVIDDMRFINELEYVNWLKQKKDYKVTTVRIIRACNETESSHQSETEMDSLKTDVTIINELTLEALYKNMDNLIKE